MISNIYPNRPQSMSYAGAGFILFTSDLQSVLLVHDSRSKKWGFPKGHREKEDENDIATATRETWEETGLIKEDYVIFPEAFKINKGSQSYIFRYAMLKHADYHNKIIYGHSHEIADMRWVPVRSLIEANQVLDGNKYLRTWIEDIQGNVSKKPVQLYKLLLERLQPLIESMGSPNVVASA
ncbi:MAG: NUDIX domain-containing protein [Sphingobacteriia bacterium]|nr:NUDIX domain-containing protein [Sphingobacteriia bacterium]